MAAGVLQIDLAVADLIDEFLQSPQTLVVRGASSHDAQRGDGVVVHAAVLGDDDGRVGDVDVNRDTERRSQPQGHRDGFGGGGAHRDGH